MCARNGFAQESSGLVDGGDGFCGVSMAAVYKVGDFVGWTNDGHIVYKGWLLLRQFMLVIRYVSLL